MCRAFCVVRCRACACEYAQVACTCGASACVSKCGCDCVARLFCSFFFFLSFACGWVGAIYDQYHGTYTSLYVRTCLCVGVCPRACSRARACVRAPVCPCARASVCAACARACNRIGISLTPGRRVVLVHSRHVTPSVSGTSAALAQPASQLTGRPGSKTKTVHGRRWLRVSVRHHLSISSAFYSRA